MNRKEGERVKLHLRIANRPGQHLEAASALLGWCHNSHNLKAWCDVQKILIWQYFTVARHSSFIATYVQGIQTVSAEAIADCLWFSIVITPCGHTSCMDWEPANFSRAGCAPLLWPARNTPLLLICTSLAEPFELCAWVTQHISHLLPCRVSFHPPIMSKDESHQRVYREGEGISCVAPGKGECISPSA